MLTTADIQARKRRLEEISLGFAKEITLIDAHDDPSLYLKRRASLMAMLDACAGIETARITLAKAVQGTVSDDRLRYL